MEIPETQTPQITKISNRVFMLSPSVKNCLDRESTNHDFYRESEKLVDIGKLGLGTRVCHKKTKTEYIIINFDKQNIIHSNLVNKINNTLNLMYNSSHCYLYRLLNHYEDEENVFLIMESYDGESLETKILNGECEDAESALKYFTEICIGVQQLHKFGMNNIKITPETVLVDICVKLTDFGLKMIGKEDEPIRHVENLIIDNHKFKISSYTTPEELKLIINRENVEINTKTDSWNLGILLFEMLTNFKSPFKTGSLEEMINDIMECNLDLSEIQDDFCRDLISKLVRKDPNERMDVKDLLDLDEIKDVEIEFKEVDSNDNIINYKEEEEEEFEGESDSNNLSRKVSESTSRKISEAVNNININNNNFDDEEKKHIALQSMVADKNNAMFLEDNEMIRDLEKVIQNYDQEKIIKEEEKKDDDNVKKKKESYKEEVDSILKDFQNLDNISLENLNIKTFENFSNYIKKKTQEFEITNNSFKELVNKLISNSEKENDKLLEESKKKIQEKEKIFNNTLNNLKNEDDKNNDSSTNELYYLEFEKLKQQKEDLIQEKYEFKKQQIQEENLRKKLKILTEQDKILEEYKNILNHQKEEYIKKSIKLMDAKGNIEKQLLDLELFIEKNNPNKQAEFLAFIEKEGDE